ncbi:uncharacterized protein LOC128883473 [Hylaeus volcanicus]|uniref:uncharacterized protein LOC128883473 n=1 Tax=Hylaeus volcanicus TaxID=313075 RepID=UPI0023B836E3|nr:uncharacterized protein LOC128883473 [Hylaeus volcanicus]
MSKIFETHSSMPRSDSFLEEHAMLSNTIAEKRHKSFKKDSEMKINEGEAVESSMIRLASVVVLMVGFSEGLTHLASLAIYYLFKDDLGLSPAQVSLLFVAPAFPWFLKPLFAFYSDSFPIFGLRRKPYLLFFSVLQTFGFILLGYGVHGVIGAVLSLFIIAFSASFCSAIAEALLVELSQGLREDASSGVSDFTMAKGVGSLLVAFFSGYLLETVPKKTVFLTTAFFPLIIFFAALPLKESIKIPSRNATQQFLELLTFLRQRLIWGPVIFILVFMAGPDYDDALFFYYTDVLDFKPSFMGTLRFTYGMAAIAGALAYRKSMYTTSYRKILWTSILFSLPIYLSPILLVTGLNLRLGISNKLFVLSGGFLNEAVAEIQLLPLLVLTACICPSGLEGSAYSTMIAVRNLGSALSKCSSSLLMFALKIDGTHFDHLVAFICICGCFNLLPFFFLRQIPTDKELESVSNKRNSSLLLETPTILSC